MGGIRRSSPIRKRELVKFKDRNQPGQKTRYGNRSRSDMDHTASCVSLPEALPAKDGLCIPSHRGI